MGEVSGAVVAVALVLCAVFIPTAFISGITGQFYRQFALTIAVSTVISAFNSLTLSPALGALLIRPHHGHDDILTRLLNASLGWFFRLFNRSFDWASGAYARLVRRLVRGAVIVLVLYAALAGLGGWLFKKVPGGFIPPQDMGYMIAVVQLPDAASFERTDAVVRRVDEIARGTPGIAHTFALSGYSSVLQANQSNLGAALFILDEFENRKSPERQSDRLIAKLRQEFSTIEEARVIVLPPPALRGLGNAGGFKIQVQDLNNAGLPALEATTQQLLAAAQKDPLLTSLITGFRANSPQYHLDLDRAQAKTMGVALADVNEALQVYLGSSYVNDFNLFDRTYQQILAGNSITYIFPLCVLFVFLVLAALYESWSLPLAIILIIPMCLLSAIGGVWLLDRDNNIFTQIGLVVLVGLAAKNAILIVEFAKQKQDAGMNRVDAAVEACRLRLRPLLGSRKQHHGAAAGLRPRRRRRNGAPGARSSRVRGRRRLPCTRAGARRPG